MTIIRNAIDHLQSRAFIKMCTNYTNVDATGADSATFEITDATLYALTVTLLAQDNAKLTNY